jgi:RHS repeat-associated protein
MCSVQLLLLSHHRLLLLCFLSTAIRTGFGRRLWKQAGGETTLFFSSDEGLVAEYDPTGADIRSYGYRPDSTWTTDPLWLKQDGEYYFYHNDYLGTPQKLVKQNGAVVWSASYTAFGQATVEVETVTNNLRFPGQYFDAETGWHYNWHRYYAPGIGRYVRIDPVGLDGGLNVYAYANNAPLQHIDPKGLSVAPALAIPKLLFFCLSTPLGYIVCPAVALTVWYFIQEHIVSPCAQDVSVWWDIIVWSKRNHKEHRNPPPSPIPRESPVELPEHAIPLDIVDIIIAPVAGENLDKWCKRMGKYVQSRKFGRAFIRNPVAATILLHQYILKCINVEPDTPDDMPPPKNPFDQY